MGESRIILGAMSGTSSDGVDIAVLEVWGIGLSMTAKLRLHHHRPYDSMTRQRILDVRRTGSTTLADLARLGHEITLTYAAACNEALIAAHLNVDEVEAVAAHGQTLYHEPPLTMQHFNPALLAAEVGCAVVSDFRRADCAAGGQGAPLVPLADYLLFRDPNHSRVLVNIGGISNITYLRAGGLTNEVIAFDTGPGNCISDAIMRHRANAPHDPSGHHALQGTVHQELARQVIRHDYFLSEPPKTTDVPTMLAIYDAARNKVIGEDEFSLNDELATACTITARSIIQSAFTMDFIPKYPAQIIISGGGSKNQAITRALHNELDQLKSDDGPLNFNDVSLQTIDELGIPSQAKEAISFGLLGVATLDEFPGNLPSATGARRSAILGSITPRPY